ncbi:hypothetical protein K435DRAFT_811554 [Dendrothele bispora CBS 962.96]|uniref:Uncharacterized protein n=1 Tax=Dendrothele bispora (strain CBS 962.96) TaxID=1314807 RepID=A0A4V4HB93_DENBC|nr:hypothetical protein K435DRAFT_811554 [Dendrothele bispora CBS 962.96]
MRQFPCQFRLPDLTAITGSVCELKSNPHIHNANNSSEAIGAYYGENLKRFLSHRFDLFAELSFPDADQHHLETCIEFFIWAFSAELTYNDVQTRGKGAYVHGHKMNGCRHFTTAEPDKTGGIQTDSTTISALKKCKGFEIEDLPTQREQEEKKRMKRRERKRKGKFCRNSSSLHFAETVK